MSETGRFQDDPRANCHLAVRQFERPRQSLRRSTRHIRQVSLTLPAMAAQLGSPRRRSLRELSRPETRIRRRSAQPLAEIAPLTSLVEVSLNTSRQRT